MRIAMVSPYSWAHPGGVNNHVSGLAGEMVGRGHRVIVIAPDHGPAPEGTRFVTAGRSIGVPANGSIAHLSLLPGTPGRVSRALDEVLFDVVHVHEPFVPLVSLGAVRAARCRVVGTFHAAGDGASIAYNIARLTCGRLFRRLDHRLAVSEPARALASRYFPGDYEVVPNGVDLDRFHPGYETPCDFPVGGGPVVLFVGRKEKRKGLSVLLRAFPAVAGAVPGCRLLIIGEGYEPGAALPVEGAPRGSVQVLGRVRNEDLPAYYASSDALCSPALAGESFGVVLIEAMACGTPVVASDLPGYRSVVLDTGGGRLFKTGVSESLADALVDVLSDERMRADLARRGVEGVRRYSWRALGDRLEQIYLGG